LFLLKFPIKEEEPFISDLRFKKHSFDIPWLTGITSEEGIFKSVPISTNTKRKKNAIEWEKLLPPTSILITFIKMIFLS
jgi:hypothetical protein